MPHRSTRTAQGPPSRPDPEFLIRCTDDDEFDLHYPKSIRDLSSCHWSPVNVCRLAARLLVTSPGTRVLDIGSGPGKFCIVGAANTEGHFTGVEQRAQLVRAAQSLIVRHGVRRAEVRLQNIVDLDFQAFDAFYLFNPFMENIFTALRIDCEIDLSSIRYLRYVAHVRQQLSQMPFETRVVTYCGDHAEIPHDYECERTAFTGKLRLWVRRPVASALAGAESFIRLKSETSRRPVPSKWFSDDVPRQGTALV